MEPRYRPPDHSHGFDPVSRLLHWVAALAILGTFALGLWMIGLPAGTEAEVARLFRSYSLHKTLGVGVFCLALLRIGWTLIHPGPGPLHPERRGEVFLASVTHWGLWIGMLALPATGFLHHAAAPGFAPVLWPFGQTLPFVPADEALALIFRRTHELSGWLLAALLGLHVAGALKHMLIDRDATLARMVTGTGPAAPPAPCVPLAIVTAFALWSSLAVAAVLTAPPPDPDPFSDLPADLIPME